MFPRREVIARVFCWDNVFKSIFEVLGGDVLWVSFAFSLSYHSRILGVWIRLEVPRLFKQLCMHLLAETC